LFIPRSRLEDTKTGSSTPQLPISIAHAVKQLRLDYRDAIADCAMFENEVKVKTD
jgi:hypothetical protein